MSDSSIYRKSTINNRDSKAFYEILDMPRKPVLPSRPGKIPVRDVYEAPQDIQSKIDSMKTPLLESVKSIFTGEKTNRKKLIKMVNDSKRRSIDMYKKDISGYQKNMKEYYEAMEKYKKDIVKYNALMKDYKIEAELVKRLNSLL